MRVVSEEQHLDVLRILDLDLKKKDMIVLGALLKAQREPTEFIEFDALREQLAKDEGGRKGKNELIYRSLSQLEQIGLIEVDRGGYKHGYNSGLKLLQNVLRDGIKAKTSDMKKELKSLDTEIKTLSDLSPEVIASSVLSLLAGKQAVERPVFAQGWRGILSLIDEKIYKTLKKNDLVRITLEWYSNREAMTESRIKNIEKILRKGVEIRGIEHRFPEKKRLESFVPILNDLSPKGFNFGYRICPRADATYQFISKNREGIILIVSENPLSATWTPRSANPDLVDNAISSFDSDFENGSDIFDYLE